METPRPRPGGRSSRVRTRVLEASVQELAEVGYAGLTMEGIARRAEVNKTTLYRRWGSREGLLLDAMLERGQQRVPIPDTGSLREDLLAIARAVAASVQAPEVQGMIRAVASEAQAPDSVIVEAVRRFWAERFAVDGQVVERAVARGEAASTADAKTVIEAVLGPIYWRLLVTREEPDDGFVQRIVDLVTAGLGVAGAGQPAARAVSR